MIGELRPCPACGAPATCYRQKSFARELNNLGPYWVVECDACWVKGRWESKEEAVAAWNRRTPDGAERVHSQDEGDRAPADPKIGPSSLGERGLEPDVVRLVIAFRNGEMIEVSARPTDPNEGA